jgi:hypothetical protein
MPVYRNLGDELHGERIAVSARSIGAIRVINRTHRHKGQFTILKDDAHCVIEIPLKIVTNKK